MYQTWQTKKWYNTKLKPEKIILGIWKWNLQSKIDFQQIPNSGSTRHFIGPCYGSKNCLMPQFQKSTEISNRTLFLDHVTMLPKITVKYGGPCISSKTLCSRNFQNVKLKKHGVEILQFARFYMKSNFGAFKQSKMSFLALLEVLNFNSSKF